MKSFDEMSGPERWEYLNATVQKDAESDWAKEAAGHVVALSGGRPAVAARLALALARDGITYETDRDRVGRQAFEPPSETWARGTGACHSKAKMVVAILLAAGIPARLEPVWAPSAEAEAPPDLPHVFASVDIHGAHIPLEPTLSRARFGERMADVPKESNGKWKT